MSPPNTTRASGALALIPSWAALSIAAYSSGVPDHAHSPSGSLRTSQSWIAPSACSAIAALRIPNSSASVYVLGTIRIPSTGRSYFSDSPITSSTPLQSGSDAPPKIPSSSTSTRIRLAPSSFASEKMRSFRAGDMQHVCTIACAATGDACAVLAMTARAMQTARSKLT
jgi:hypothetical protein